MHSDVAVSAWLGAAFYIVYHTEPCLQVTDVRLDGQEQNAEAGKPLGVLHAIKHAEDSGWVLVTMLTVQEIRVFARTRSPWFRIFVYLMGKTMQKCERLHTPWWIDSESWLSSM